MRKRDRIEKFVGFYATPALKRDLWRIALAKGLSLSQTVRALLRLGFQRDVELADAEMFAPLRALLEEILGPDASFGEAAGECVPGNVGAKEFLARRQARVTNDRQFDAAVDEGLRKFARRSANP